MKFLLLCCVIILLSKTEAFNNEGEVRKIDDNLLRESVTEAKSLVHRAYRETRENLKLRLKRETVTLADIMAYAKQPAAQSRNAIRYADYLDLTLKIVAKKLKYIYPCPFNVSDVLTPEQKEILNQLTGCAYIFLPKVCTSSPYRTITGECNNRKKPWLGASNTPFIRLVKAQYEDNVYIPRGWSENRLINGFLLPKPREVSNKIVNYGNKSPITDTERSIMFMHWAQWVDHDTDLSPDTPARSAFFEGVDCDTSCVKAHPCYPLMIPKNDPRITNQSECISLFRSAPACNLVSPVRELINALTSFVDASQVYGSDPPLAKMLRNNTNNLGLLAINQNYTDGNRSYLPFSGDNEDMCTKTNTTAKIPCMVAGDIRASEQTGLTTIHTMFLREHNRIATELHKLNPCWSGDRLYEETRKIIAGIEQKITYKDYLPLMLGNEMQYVLPPYTSYDDQVDPRVSNAFAIANRIGHTLVNPIVYRLKEGYQPHDISPYIMIQKTFFAPWLVVKLGGITPFVRGMLINPAKKNQQDQIVDNALRDHLFEQLRPIALDLPALNMQRGRDHGVPGYNTYRRFCNLSAPRDVDELAAVLHNETLAKLLIDLYGTSENIDLWIGGVCEPLVPGGRAGHLISCIIGNQFKRARDGDRFYYERKSVFTPAQRSAIENVTLSRIICDNTDITEVPHKPFLRNRYPEDFFPCSTIPALDLNLWKDCCECDENSSGDGLAFLDQDCPED